MHKFLLINKGSHAFFTLKICIEQINIPGILDSVTFFSLFYLLLSGFLEGKPLPVLKYGGKIIFLYRVKRGVSENGS